MNALTESVARRFGRGWFGSAWTALLVATVAAICGYLLTPSIYGQRIPYGEESVNLASTTVIKAQRDYDIPDEETTAKKRAEARALVKPVYRHDATALASALDRITASFGMMRDAALSVRSRLKAERAPEEGGMEDRPSRRRRSPSDEAVARELRRVFDERRADFSRALEASLDDEAFHALAEAEFSALAEREAKRLLRNALQDLVAEYRDELTARGLNGITVLRVDGTRLSERDVADVTGIRDQNAVRAEVERSSGELPEAMTASQRLAVVQLVARCVRANLRHDAAEFEARQRQAEQSVKPVVIQLKKGEKILGDGERIERRHLVVFRAIREQAQISDLWVVRLGGSLVAAILVVVCYAFARTGLRGFRPTRKDALLMATALVSMLVLVNFGTLLADVLHDRFVTIPANAFVAAIPFAAGAMLLRFVIGSEAALVFSVAFAGLVGIRAGNSLTWALYALVGSLVGAHTITHAKDRASVVMAGIYAGAANLVLAVAGGVASGKVFASDTYVSGLFGFLGGAVAAPTLVMFAAFLAETIFGYTTDIKLLELANLNHPALKELIVQAPGTYHHSIIVGSLVEAGAEAIGANSLLARVCAYYHDIGKGRNPLYFGENQKGENRHDKLAPAMSAMIIRRHVTDGMEMARQYALPKQVADAIPQHHGTRLVGYFFHKALKEKEGEGAAGAVDETAYRYTGPKPQSREAALVMIADAVEAASRAMVEPTPQKLQSLVQKIINSIFADGQLDECELTLRDLNEIARSYFRTLEAIYHTRPEYPAPAVSPTRRDGVPALSEVGTDAPATGDGKRAGPPS